MLQTTLEIGTGAARPGIVRVDLPFGRQPRATAVLAHESAAQSAADRIAIDMNRLGVAVAHATGEPGRAVIQALAARWGGPDFLVGHGRAGAELLALAPGVPTLRAVAVIGIPSDPDIEQALASLRRPFLVLHAPLDGEVGIAHAGRLMDAARHPKSFVALDGADHALSRDRDARFAASMITAWFGRYVPPDTDHGHGAGAWIGRDRYRTEIRAGHHGIVADEPVSAGGTDEGATPYDLFLAGLGGCTAVTVRMYADRKGWPLEAVYVSVSHEKADATVQDSRPGASGRIDLITTRVALRGPLDDDQRARLMEIAERCPVHRTLKQCPTLRTIAVEAPEPGQDGPAP